MPLSMLMDDWTAPIFQNQWLGGRDSNPDTQIQSLSEDAASKEDQQPSPANRAQTGQNPQRRRKKSFQLTLVL
jgi:hypothetical protein